jgi:hypothetical protein
MIQQTIRAYSESRLQEYVAKLQRLGWATLGVPYHEGLFWYQTVART